MSLNVKIYNFLQLSGMISGGYLFYRNSNSLINLVDNKLIKKERIINSLNIPKEKEDLFFNVSLGITGIIFGYYLFPITIASNIVMFDRKELNIIKNYFVRNNDSSNNDSSNTDSNNSN